MSYSNNIKKSKHRTGPATRTHDAWTRIVSNTQPTLSYLKEFSVNRIINIMFKMQFL